MEQNPVVEGIGGLVKDSPRRWFVKALFGLAAFILSARVFRAVPFSVLYADHVDLIRWLMLTGAVLLALLILDYWRGLGSLVRWAASGMILGVALALSWDYAQVVIASVGQPPVWDFQLFWVFGQAAARGLDPYNHASLVSIATVLDPSAEFLNELFFLHPPPAVFLYWPLGWFDLRAAALLWYAANGAAFLLSALLIWRLFLRKADGWVGLPVAVLLMLGMRASLSTFVHGQTNFLVLLVLLVYWWRQESKWSGALLGVGMIIKPVVAFVPLFSLSLRRLREIAAMVLSVVALLLLSALPLGTNPVLAYVIRNPILNDMPTSLYFEDMVQSLFGMVLKQTAGVRQELSAASLFLPVLGTVALMVASLWLMRRIGRTSEPMAFGLAVVTALLAFPKTLSHYAVLLVIPWLILWAEQPRLLGSFELGAALLAVLFGLANLGGSFVFWAMAATWMSLGVLGLTASATVAAPPMAASVGEGSPPS
jgi:hypothetical protein